MKNNKTIIIMGVVIISLIYLLGFKNGTSGKTPFGSVAIGNEYHATTTSPTAYAFSSGERLLQTGPGTFGGITVTGAGSAGGNIEFFDATTTNPSLRASSMSSTTQLIASFPSNLGTGNYQDVDIAYTYGLIMVIKGTIGTTTVTYR